MIMISLLMKEEEPFTNPKRKIARYHSIPKRKPLMWGIKIQKTINMKIIEKFNILRDREKLNTKEIFMIQELFNLKDSQKKPLLY